MFNSFLKHVLLVISLTCFLSAAFAGVQPAGNPPCRVDFYFIPGCEQCLVIEEDILPRLKEMFGERIRLRRHNLYDSEEYAEARNLLNRLAIQKEANVFIVIDGEIYVGGSGSICRDLIPVVEEQLYSASKLATVSREYAVEQGATAGGVFSFPFSVLALLAAGLIDGLNPCAFATIVFLISLLLAGGRRKGGILLVGLGFCTAVYLTYFLIGLGLFQVFRMSIARFWLNNILHWLLSLILLIFALLSFRDAWVFRLTGRANDVILKLPGWINRLIHRVIRLNLSWKYYFAGSFFLGLIVTVLESVCTGQLYVPTLAFLARLAGFKLQALAYLALYNVMFILPLVAVFILAYCGTSHLAFLAWSRKNVFWAKCALGCFFVFLAVVLYLA